MAQTSLVTAAPSSSVRISNRQTASRRLWGFDWAEHTPWQVDDVSVEYVSFTEALPFMEEHWSKIFGEQYARFLSDPMTPAKRRFCDDMDVLAFRSKGDIAHGQTIGLLIGHPQDWSTYYMRGVAILPAFRKRHLLTRIVEWADGPLRAAGVDRIEGECSPANVAMIKMLVGLGYVATGTSSSERWGTLLRYSKFLREEAEEIFARQFCGMRLKAVRSGGCSAPNPLERRTS
jgi:RimJ/RimL family protein N-acetyltransferase